MGEGGGGDLKIGRVLCYVCICEDSIQVHVVLSCCYVGIKEILSWRCGYRVDKLRRGGGDEGRSSVGRVSDRHVAEAGSISRCGKGLFCCCFFVFFIPKSTFSADSLTVSVQPPCAIACILTFVRTLKIPSIGSHTFVWTQGNTYALLGMGSAALAAVVGLLR